MAEMVKNSLGRLVPTEVNGFRYEPYAGAWAPLQAGPRFVLPTVTAQSRGTSKVVKNLDDVIGANVPDGGWISMPHYYRDDPTALKLVLDSLRRCGKKSIHLMGIAFFNSHCEPLMTALKEGLLGGVEGNVYDTLAAAVGRGELLPWVVPGRTHGGRARAFQCGEREIDLAIAPVPIADAWGNANGIMGNPSSLCGPLGLFEPDSRWAKRVCLLAEDIYPGLLSPSPIDMRNVDFVVPVKRAGDNRGIATGTTDIRRVKTERNRVADNCMKVMEAAGVIHNGFNFQIGSGAGLLVLEKMLRKMRANGIRGGFTVGGSMEYHVDLLEERLIELFLDGQCFQPSVRLFESLRTNPRHVEVSTSLYYSPAAKCPSVMLMDVVILGCSEIDVQFNANTVTGYDGVLRTGIGGGPDAAAGGKLTIFALPFTRVNKAKQACPCVRKEVTTIVTPGEVISCVVTEDYVAVNPKSDSPYIPAIRDNAKAFGLNLVSIEEIADAAMAKAKELGPLMPEPHFTDDVVYAVEWRDGRLIDVVRKQEAAKKD
ncbi:MAG: citrate lyase subunit alpha [Candidatus Brocadiia bacterium]